MDDSFQSTTDAGRNQYQYQATKTAQRMTIEWPSEWDSARPKSASETDARERHKLAERERRKSMRELFLNLHALLPHASTVRKEQSAILEEIVKYIPLAVSRLRSLQSRRDLPAAQKQRHASEGAPTVHVSEPNSGDCDIRVAPEPASSVAIRVRGDRVNVSLTDTKATSQAVLLSSVLDELDTHQLELVRSTHCRDGAKLLHHSETKIRDGLDLSPALLKEKLQDLACKLHKLRKTSSLKRTIDQIS